MDTVRVYLDGEEGTGTLLGEATYGISRPDVANYFGDVAFTDSGYQFSWDTSGTSPGTHTLFVAAHTLCCWHYKTVQVNVSASGSAPLLEREPQERQIAEVALRRRDEER